MDQPSDLWLNASKFTHSDEAEQLNALVEPLSNQGPKWYEVGAATYRQMWEDGQTPLPQPIYLAEAEDSSLPSRDEGRTIPIRVYRPQIGALSRGIIVHFHGGGFVLGSHRHQDATLKRFAGDCQLTAISIGYRLAPEHPFPSGLHDCIDVAIHLIDNGLSLYGSTVRFLAGESAGACLAFATAFHLMRERPAHQLAGILSTFGHFDLTLSSPSVSLAKRTPIINNESMRRFAEAYVPDTTLEERKNPLVSPLFEDLRGLADMREGGKLPPALFMVGSVDPLVDDTVVMAARWMGTGSQAVVRVWAGMPHGFTALPCRQAGEAWEVMVEFVRGRMAGQCA